MKRLLIGLGLWAALTGSVLAQSTATPVVTGYLTTSGCPAGQTACFVQYGAGGGGIAANVQITGPLGSQNIAASVATTTSDGALVTLGAKADAKSSATDATPITLMQVDKEISYLLQNGVAVTAASLPLPTGAATSANQTNASQKTQIVDGSGNVIAATSNALNVNITGGGGTTGAVFGPTATTNPAANPPVLIGGTSTESPTGTLYNLVVSTSGSGHTLDDNSASALTALNSIVTNTGAAIPAGTNTIGAVTGPSAAPLALDSSLATINTTLGGATPAGTNNIGVMGYAQESTTSGQVGLPAGCAVTTSSPTYTTAKTDFLSCDTTGALRISAPAASPVNVNVTTPPNDVKTGPTTCTSTATCTAITVSTQGAGSVGISITGSGSGMVFTFQGSIDGTNWFAIGCLPPGLNPTPVSTGAANGNWFCPPAGYQLVRVDMTAFTSGTATLTLNASAGSAQPVLGAVANAVEIDGSNGAALSAANPIFSADVPTTSGGLLVKHIIVANNTTSIAVKASAGQLYKIIGNSVSAATPVWVKMYNTAQGSTTCGSGTVVSSTMIPAPGASGGGTNVDLNPGVTFSTAITVCITAGQADADATSPAATTYSVDLYYK